MSDNQIAEGKVKTATDVSERRDKIWARVGRIKTGKEELHFGSGGLGYLARASKTAAERIKPRLTQVSEPHEEPNKRVCETGGIGMKHGTTYTSILMTLFYWDSPDKVPDEKRDMIQDDWREEYDKPRAYLDHKVTGRKFYPFWSQKLEQLADLPDEILGDETARQVAIAELFEDFKDEVEDLSKSVQDDEDRAREMIDRIVESENSQGTQKKLLHKYYRMTLSEEQIWARVGKAETKDESPDFGHVEIGNLAQKGKKAAETIEDRLLDKSQINENPNRKVCEDGEIGTKHGTTYTSILMTLFYWDSPDEVPEHKTPLFENDWRGEYENPGMYLEERATRRRFYPFWSWKLEELANLPDEILADEAARQVAIAELCEYFSENVSDFSDIIKDDDDRAREMIDRIVEAE